MSHARTIKLDQRAFKRGFDDVVTLKPLRDAMSALVVHRSSKSGKFVVSSTIRADRNGNDQGSTRKK